MLRMGGRTGVNSHGIRTKLARNSHGFARNSHGFARDSHHTRTELARALHHFSFFIVRCSFFIQSHETERVSLFVGRAPAAALEATRAALYSPRRCEGLDWEQDKGKAAGRCLYRPR